MGIRTVERPLSDERVRRSIFRILRSNVLCSMSTVTRDHRAHINTAYFCCSPDLEFYFLSYPTSLHCRNLRTNPSMAMTVFSSGQTWGGPDRGLQLFGRCMEAQGPQAERAERLYARRFRLYRKYYPQLGSLRFYRFLPTRVKVFDEREFGTGVFVNTIVRREPRSTSKTKKKPS